MYVRFVEVFNFQVLECYSYLQELLWIAMKECANKQTRKQIAIKSKLLLNEFNSLVSMAS